MRETVGAILAGPNPPEDQSVFVYVTATDLIGRWLPFVDTTGRRFQERDHRRVLAFEHRHDDDVDAKPATPVKDLAMPVRVRFKDGNAPELLARAGRATSSFPIAFEPHGLAFIGEKPTDKPDHRWLIDGGLLDNQPFKPVLNQISVLPSTVPVRRVLAYVVPYVNEPSRSCAGPQQRERRRTRVRPSLPTAREVYAATGALPRTLPKLESLERVRREWREQATRRATGAALAGRPTRPSGRSGRWRRAREDQAGRGTSPAGVQAHAILRLRSGSSKAGSRSRSCPATGCSPRVRLSTRSQLSIHHSAYARRSAQRYAVVTGSGGVDWKKDDVWRWGLSPAERVAAWALLFLRDALEEVEQRELALAAR